jgi:hypothetical protein
MLSADRLYLHDNESVFGHVFIALLSLFAYCKREMLLLDPGGLGLCHFMGAKVISLEVFGSGSS